jgi:hypothetical protein
MESLRQPIAEARKRKTELQAEQSKIDQFIYKCQDICEHDWKEADDLYNYHNRISYDRCTICGRER